MTTHIVYNRHDLAHDFVASFAEGGARGFRPCKGLCVADSDTNEIIGAVLFHGWYPEAGTIEISVASTEPRWLNRRIIEATYDYVFNQLGCQMAIHSTRSHLRHVQRIARAIGCDEYVIKRGFGRGADMHVLTLTAEQWAESKFNRGARHENARTADAA